MIIFNTCHLLQAKVGRWKECDSALQCLRGKHADVYQEATEMRVYNKFLVWFGIVWSGDMKVICK